MLNYLRLFVHGKKDSVDRIMNTNVCGHKRRQRKQMHFAVIMVAQGEIDLMKRKKL